MLQTLNLLKIKFLAALGKKFTASQNSFFTKLQQVVEGEF